MDVTKAFMIQEAVVQILKKRFPNLTVDEALKISRDIVEHIQKVGVN